MVSSSSSSSSSGSSSGSRCSVSFSRFPKTILLLGLGANYTLVLSENTDHISSSGYGLREKPGEGQENGPIYGADGSLQMPPPSISSTSSNSGSGKRTEEEDKKKHHHKPHSLVEKISMKRKEHEREQRESGRESARESVRESAQTRAGGWQQDEQTWLGNLQPAYKKMKEVDQRESQLEMWRNAADSLSQNPDDFPLPEQNELIRFRDVSRQLLVEFG